MNNSADQTAEDDENVTVSTSGMITPASTITHHSTNWQIQEPTIVILLEIEYYRNSKKLQIKMRTNMMFGQVVAMLKARYRDSENYHLRFGKLEKIQDKSEYRMIFDSDTPASLGLENHTILRFESPRDTEGVDMTIMQCEPQTV